MVLRSLRVLLWIASAAALAVFVVVAARSLGAPVPLDPLEATLMDHASRLTEAVPLYAAPDALAGRSVMPGFPAAIALLSVLFGPGLWEPRLLGFLGFLGGAVLAALIVRRETNSWTYGVASAGLLLLGYGLVEVAPGTARPEGLTLVAVIGGYLALRSESGIAGAILAGALFAAACFIQLSAAWLVAAAVFHQAHQDRRRLLAFLVTFAVMFGGGFVVLSKLLGPWFNFQASDALVSTVRFDPLRLLHFVGHLLLGQLGVLTLMAVLAFALPVRPWRGQPGLWMCLGLGALALGVVATQSAAATTTGVIFSVVALALVGPMSMQRLTQHLAAWPGSSRLGGQGVVLVALALQFVALFSTVRLPAW